MKGTTGDGLGMRLPREGRGLGMGLPRERKGLGDDALGLIVTYFQHSQPARDLKTYKYFLFSQSWLSKHEVCSTLYKINI